MFSARAKSLFNYIFSKTDEMIDSEEFLLHSSLPNYILFLATLGNTKEEGLNV
jgi:hypothetical protein